MRLKTLSAIKKAILREFPFLKGERSSQRLSNDRKVCVMTFPGYGLKFIHLMTSPEDNPMFDSRLVWGVGVGTPGTSYKITYTVSLSVAAHRAIDGYHSLPDHRKDMDKAIFKKLWKAFWEDKATDPEYRDSFRHNCLSNEALVHPVQVAAAIDYFLPHLDRGRISPCLSWSAVPDSDIEEWFIWHSGIFPLSIGHSLGLRRWTTSIDPEGYICVNESHSDLVSSFFHAIDEFCLANFPFADPDDYPEFIKTLDRPEL